MAQIAATLSARPVTKAELRAAKNRRYYQRVREMHQWRWKLRRLAEVAQIITGESPCESLIAP